MLQVNIVLYYVVLGIHRSTGLAGLDPGIFGMVIDEFPDRELESWTRHDDNNQFGRMIIRQLIPFPDLAMVQHAE